jgi:hypothetical protein
MQFAPPGLRRLAFETPHDLDPMACRRTVPWFATSAQDFSGISNMPAGYVSMFSHANHDFPPGRRHLFLQRSPRPRTIEPMRSRVDQ